MEVKVIDGLTSSRTIALENLHSVRTKLIHDSNANLLNGFCYLR
ncbi:hypothetical protein ALP29_03181 [Pseudomonas syringae pv. avii]|uniref:Uncharacterized protein n=3 Tax=Pseudomonas syringae group TaxID=136849 RepID=A0A3M5U6Q9_PSESX|nr:hypothetical protein ALQ56_02507 [Pseudomonas syringae pv. papulans]RMU41609.1 hypothetical protein ALP29_03181 [Pseudomonas syringae pv. avii]SOQ15910.1 hypothetical protein CFBP1573P_05810 [Pseudomonas syringae pv. persicae]SOS32975.1 hypothetical protein CFBP6411_01615 [Pseudomonas syringae group genomosp. 3]SOQ16461.1 hypothetical protein NCPPB2254_05918 [Pseudomonas syringae pv. persicae]